MEPPCEGDNPCMAAEFRLSEVIAALSHALDLTEGQPQGHAARSCLIGMRARRPRSACPAREAGAALLRAAAEGRRLLQQRGARQLAVRGRRPARQARAQARRLDEHDRGPALRPQGRRAAGRSPLRRAGRLALAAVELGLDNGALFEARCERGAADRAHAGVPAGGRRGRALARRALERQGPAGRPEGRGDPDPGAGSPASRRRSRSSTTTAASTAVRDDAARAARTLVRPRARRRAARPPRRRRPVAAARRGRRAGRRPGARRRGAGGGRRAPRPHHRGLRAGHRREVAVHLQPLEPASPTIATRIGRRSSATAADALRALRRMGLLHDIGKLGVSSRILDKPAKLTDEEFAAGPPPPGLHRRDPAAGSRLRAPRGGRRGAPRAPRRPRLPARARRRRGQRERPHPGRRRRVRGADGDAPVPRPAAGRTRRSAIMRRDVGAAFCPRAFGALESALAGPGLALAA